MTASRSPGAALLPIFFLLACRPGTAERPAASDTPAMSASEAPPPKSSKPQVLSTSDRGITLDKERTTVAVKVPVALPESLGSEGGGGRLGLYLDGVEGRSGAFFEVYANLPRGAKPDPASPYYLGTLSAFGPKGGAGATVGYDIGKLVRALESEGRWDGDLTLTFLRRGLEPPAGQPSPRTAPKETPAMRVKRVRVVRE
jgi:hypothetical protein